MSYFTETLDETMELLEFKGEAEYAYAMKRAAERGTHAHGKMCNGESQGKFMHRIGVSNVSSKSARDTSNPHNSSFTPSELKGHKADPDDPFDSTTTTRENYRRQVNYHNSLVSHGNDPRDTKHAIEKHNRKMAKRESYDPVYAELVSMGVID